MSVPVNIPSEWIDDIVGYGYKVGQLQRSYKALRVLVSQLKLVASILIDLFSGSPCIYKREIDLNSIKFLQGE